jgi:hypothetical protein
MNPEPSRGSHPLCIGMMRAMRTMRIEYHGEIIDLQKEDRI